MQIVRNKDLVERTKFIYLLRDNVEVKVSPSRGQAGRARPGQGAGAASAAKDEDKAAALSATLREGLTNISQVISGIAQIAQTLSFAISKRSDITEENL